MSFDRREKKEISEKEIGSVGGWDGFSPEWCFHLRLKGFSPG
jgi:hypothetical protein